LASIRGTAQLLRRQLARSGTIPLERLTLALGTIEETSLRMAELINDMLDVTRLRMGQRLDLTLRPTDLVALARQAVMVQQQATEARRIVLEASLDALVGDWDAARLGRVLGNLLDNAVKYSPGGGAITVAVARDGDWAILRVRDRGVGIPAEDLPHVFDWYRRGSNVKTGVGGSGIGLASVRRIVEQHGGTITVESRQGKGSEFTVRLPLSSANAEVR
jgi:signal transduction histidine kinase